MASDVRTLADRLHTRLLGASPFDASMLGIPGYDALVPDSSVEAEATVRADLEAVLVEARTLDAPRSGLPEVAVADRVTLDCIVDTVERTLLDLDAALVDLTVSPMPLAGPPVLLAVAARTLISDSGAAEDYLERLRASGDWLAQEEERLRDGAARGRLPVGPLVEAAVAWADEVLRDGAPPALLAPAPPGDWDGAKEWRRTLEDVVREFVTPAVARWRALLVDELLPVARPPERAGLVHVPGGEADYERMIRVHTTLPVTADDLHRTGLDHVAALEDREREIGAGLGLADLASIHQAMRIAAAESDPDLAMAAALAAIRRAEERSAEVFPAPLPPPCEVSPMPPSVAESGMAPHYTPPRLDGGRPGTYWYNTVRPTAGGGWDLEAVAFHEAVPGHHLQLSREQMLTHLPALQRQRHITAHAEGWGLYAEQLAEEMGLYSDSRQLLGVVTASLMRAARLVVDTGLHARGWSRQEATDYMAAHVPMPVEFLGNEVDRYIAMPGQALAYLTGRLEILRLREEAQGSLGDRFTLPGFHAAVLDHGSLPLPVLARSVQAWVASV
jgi:uncharacterized protein (DUF885 family)